MNNKIIIIFFLLTLFNINKVKGQNIELVKNIASATENTEVIKSIIDGKNIFLIIENKDKKQTLYFYNHKEQKIIKLFTDSTYTTESTAFGAIKLWKNKVYWAYGKVRNRQLWVSDGTSNGTKKIHENIGLFAQESYEMNPRDDGYNEWFMASNNILYFHTLQNSRTLWRTDGTSDGTYSLDKMNNPFYVPNNDSRSNLFYYIRENEIWASNGNEVFFVSQLDTYGRIDNYKIVNFDSYSLLAIESSRIFTLYSLDPNIPKSTKIINPKSTINMYLSYVGFGHYRGKTFFNWIGNNDDQEIWQTDGSIGGTAIKTNVKDPEINFSLHGTEENTMIYKSNLDSLSIYGSLKDRISLIDTSKIIDLLEKYPWIAIKKSYYGNGHSKTYLPKAILDKKLYLIEFWSKYLYEVDIDTNIIQSVYSLNTNESYVDIHKANNKLFLSVTTDGNNQNKILVKSGNTLYNLTDSITTTKPFHLNILKASEDVIYFTAIDSVHGKEVWVTDGTSKGTYLIYDISSEPNSSFPTHFFEFEDGVFFIANDGFSGNEPWFTSKDGSFVNQMHNLHSNKNYNFLGSIKFNNFIYTIFEGTRLFRYNKNIKSQVRHFSYGNTFFPLKSITFEKMGNSVFFPSYDIYEGINLFKLNSDGYISKINIGPITISGPNPKHLKAVGNTLYFSADVTSTGRELYKTDGSSNGTLVKDITFRGSTDFSNFHSFQNKLVFVTDSNKVWISNGTNTGTYTVYNFGSTNRIIEGFKEFNGSLYFGVKHQSLPGLYRLDSQFHVEYIGYLNLNNTSIFSSIEKGDTLYISTKNDLYLLDQQSNSIHTIYPGLQATNFIHAFGNIYFTGCFENECEIWQIGKQGKIEKTADIYSGKGSSNPTNFFLSNQSLYFSAYRPDIGYELFRINNCPETLEDSSTYSYNQSLSAQQSIKSISKITNKSNIDYKAGYQIELLPGFETQRGIIFSAKIKGCVEN